MAKHYINNAEFLDAIVKYKQACLDAENEAEPKPKIPEYVGECILKIAKRLAQKPNFANYSYKDDMISDGIENCMLYFDNFSPAKSSNPFAYFTQIIHFAFIRRILKEKKQTLIKGKILLELPFDMYDLQGHEDSDHGTFMTEHGMTHPHLESMRNTAYNDVVAKDIEKKKKKKEAKEKEAEGMDEILEVIEHEENVIE